MTPSTSAPRSAGTFPRLLSCTLLALAPLAACDTGDAAMDGSSARPALSAPQPMEPPTGSGSGEPNLVAASDGLYLTWLERSAEDRYALRFSRWDDQSGWSEARTVMDRPDLFVNWADFPSLAQMDDGTLAAHWLEKSGPGAYSYDVRMAVSDDGGRTWSDDIIPHRDGIEAEHGFVSLQPMDPGLGVVWLDGRETVEGDPMTLRFTTLSSSGELGPPVLLDSAVCDCCQTGMAMAEAGPVVVYRDRSPGEVRDIAIVRRVDGTWTEPRIVHHDGWVIPGCPVNGPAVEASGQRVAVAWFTGAALEPTSERSTVRQAGEQGRVLAAFSDDGGATFSEPVRVDDGAAMGRVDLELLDDGTALVAWLERVEGAAGVRVRHVDGAGVGPATQVAGTAAERASGFPRMERLGERVMFAWTEASDTSRVRAAVSRVGDR